MKKDKSHIHWYPGHIAKAERQLKEQLKLIDVVIEVLDARIPLSSAYNDIKKLLGDKPRFLLLNKSDLVDPQEIKLWMAYLNSETGCKVLLSDGKNSFNFNKIIDTAVSLAEPKIQALMAKGLLRRPARVMVCGMPNVGKSSIINRLTRSSKTKTGAKAGVTRQQQWVRINPKLELLDTPGIIPTRQDDQNAASKLAMVNSVSENAYTAEFVARELLEILDKKYLAELREYYKISEIPTLENIALSRNWIKSAAEPDIERTAKYVLKAFRDGDIGKFILDDLPDKPEKE